MDAYRHAQETLRQRRSGDHSVDLAAEQLALAAQACRLPAGEIAELVDEWMIRAPLGLLMAARRARTVDVLDAARARGIRIGACSDYPAASKLEALGVAAYFDTVVAAQDVDVGWLKPHPRSLQVALTRLGVEASNAWYVGDRPSVDGDAARAAGVTPVILSRHYTMAQLLQDVRG